MFSDSPFNDGSNHESFMRAALREAEAALEEGEVPVGAVIVHKGRVIGRGHNQRETLQDPTAHAEMIAITQAAASLENWRLEGCRLYVTLEPCSMCSGAVVLSRIPEVIYGAADPRAGACGSVLNLVQNEKFNHRAIVVPSILAEECSAILGEFFRRRRKDDR
ncbi:MAG TPA: tRNA adenosine(34) deaminase TadA [Planctomycetes bacterium]|nr:tRNA adenosine(34) deaminase TadA [Planctomycetota bacterium]